MNLRGWSLGAVTGLLLGMIGGCGDSNTTSTDMAQSPVPICTANEKTCLNDRTAVVCSSDGLSRIPVQCAVGEKCDAGECKSDGIVACTSDENGCMNATTALRCSSTGKGFDVVTCPAGTNCVEGGLCQGACIVGSSICSDTHSLSTCADGKTYTTTSCAAADACVSTGQSPYNTAARKPADCQPDENGCDFVCGNKVDAAAAGQTTTLSFCNETPNSYKWAAIQCAAGKSRNPTASACNSGPGSQAACTQDCKPGDTRCADLLGFQTCGADGKWGTTVTACNADLTAAAFSCQPKTGVAGQVVCGDIACDGATGACDAIGKFHACGADRKVATDGTACAAGVCVADQNSPPGKWQAGSCQVQCIAGDERCVGGSTYQTCTAGLWAASAQCAANVNCIDTTNAAGRPRKVCGECLPGTHECGGTAGEQIRVCGSAATWGAFADCTAGACASPGGSADSLCVAQCFPGNKVCLGSNVTVPGVGITATSFEGTCTAQGRLPTPTACPVNTFCRRGPSKDTSSGNPGTGVPIGCVACVGTQNEFGIRDTKCSDDAGTANSGQYLTQCLANSSGWDGAANLQCTAPTTACSAASTVPPIPPATGLYCHSFGGPISGPFTQTALRAFCASSPFACFGLPPNPTCDDIGSGSAISCALTDGSTVADCCSSACKPDSAPTPAFCSP